MNNLITKIDFILWMQLPGGTQMMEIDDQLEKHVAPSFSMQRISTLLHVYLKLPLAMADL